MGGYLCRFFNCDSSQTVEDNLLLKLKTLTSPECYKKALILAEKCPAVFGPVLQHTVKLLQNARNKDLWKEMKLWISFFQCVWDSQKTELPAAEIKTVKAFIQARGETYGAHQQILDELSFQGARITTTDNPQQCDVIFLFCPIQSWIGSDVDAAVKSLPAGDKLVVLILMYHAFNPDEYLDKTRWSEQYPYINHEVRVLFHQSVGLLHCSMNDEALRTLKTIYDQSSCIQKGRDFSIGSRAQQASSQAENEEPNSQEFATDLPGPSSMSPKSTTQVRELPAAEIKTVKAFIHARGETYGAHQQILDELSFQGARITTTDNPQQCDVIFLFCPIRSRVGSDVDAAVKSLAAGDKLVVLILMYHTFSPNQYLDKTRWSQLYPCINHEVRVLFHQSKNGLLDCPMNDEALRTLKRIYDQYSCIQQGRDFSIVSEAVTLWQNERKHQ